MKIIFKLMLVTIVFNYSFSQCEGDANLDSTIDILDIVTIVNHALGIELLEGEAFENGDVDDNGEINVIDLVIVVETILNGDSECNSDFAPIDLSLEWEFQDDLSYFDSEALNSIMDEQVSILQYIQGMIVVHKGKIVTEEYYNFGSIDNIYNIWSVTKSYISTLIGQAIDEGLIIDQNSTVDNFFPDYDVDYLSTISLHNLLSMSSGYYDIYGYPYWTYVSTQDLLEMSYTFPGFFAYNNSACHINAHVLFENSGISPLEFANVNLFPYLGINNPQWLDGYNNINDGSASLELKLREMIKLGQLYLQDGYSGENQVVSSEWITEATSWKVATGFDGLDGYGYLWWLPDIGYLAYGYGGQFIAVIPELDLVIGTNSQIAGNTSSYQEQLLTIMYNQIAPLFDFSGILNNVEVNFDMFNLPNIK